MLGELRNIMRSGNGGDQPTKNAIIEAFCIHARNLNEFFLGIGQGDTLKASSFTTSKYQRSEPDEVRRSVFAKINKQISHLTEARTTVPREKIGDLEREQMYCFLFDDLKRFSDHLKPALRPAWGVKFGSDGIARS